MVDTADKGDSDDVGEELRCLAQRIREAAVSLGAQPKGAAAAQVSLTQWERYLRGAASPAFLAIARFARAAGVDLNWLAYGSGPKHRAPGLAESVDAHLRTAVDRLESQRSLPQGELDESLLQTAIEAVEMHLAERGRALPSARKAALIAILYAGARQPDVGAAKAIDPVAARRLFRLIE